MNVKITGTKKPPLKMWEEEQLCFLHNKLHIPVNILIIAFCIPKEAIQTILKRHG